MADSANNPTLQKTNPDKDGISVELIDGVSKAGNPYTCLELRVGDLYKARVFPTPVEIAYIEHVIGS